MAVETNPNKKPVEPFAPEPTFGGVLPDLNEPQAPEMSFSGVSLVDNKPNPGLTSLFSNNAPQEEAKLTDEELSRKVDRFSFALQKDFSREDVMGYLAKGNEAQLRRYAASQQDAKDEEDRKTTLKDILGEGLPETPEQQSVLYGNVKALNGFRPSNDPNTIVEKNYAKAFIHSVPTVGPADSALNQLIYQAGEKALDAQSQERIKTAQDHLLSSEEAAIRIKLYQENAKDVLERAEQKFAKESLFGKIVDFGKSSIPFLDYYNIAVDVPGMEAIGLQTGTSISQWVTKLYDQPPEVQKQWLDQAVSTIGAYNPALAMRVAEAAVSYTTTDQMMDNFFGLLDLSSVGGNVARAAKGAVAIAGSVKLLAEARNAYKTAIRAAASPHATAADFNAAMGNVNGAALHNVAQSASKGRGEPSTLSSISPTFVNPKAAPGASQGLAGAQTGRLSSYIEQRAGALRAKIDKITRINRNPEEALQAAFQETQREFEKAISQSLNNSIQNARKVTFERPVDESKLMAQIEAKHGPVDWTPDGKPIPQTKSAIAEPNKELEDRLTTKIEAKTGKPIPSPFSKTTSIRPEDTPDNLGRVEFEMTKPNGELFSGKHWERQMRGWGRLMGLEPGDYGAKQVGNGWVMTVTRPVDETKPFVRDHLLTTKNTTNPLTPLIGSWGKRGGGRVSEFSANNRIAYVTGQEKMREVIEPLANDLLRLEKDHVSALNRVMTEEMNRIHPTDNLPGHFYQDHREFEEAYRRLNGRSPTQVETNAYEAARTLNELEFGLRRSSLYKEVARLGVKKITLPAKTVDPNTGQTIHKDISFEGKIIDELPLGANDAKARAMVTVYNVGDPEPKIVPLHALLTEKGQGHIKDLQTNGYKIIHTANPSVKPGKEIFGENESVNFILTKEFHQGEVDPAKLIGYREGWHQIYPYKHWVKQPVIRKIDKADEATGHTFTHHLYEGERTWMGFHSQAEAKRYHKAMEEARQIAFEGKHGDLDLHLAENLPYTRKEFEGLFAGENPVFSKTEPFLSLGDGHISMDAYREMMEGRYGNLYDTIRSPWNIMNQVDKKFVGHRDEILSTIKEGKGSQGNPVFNLVRAERLDPLSAMSDGISNMIRNHHMIDLRLQVGESWIKEFKHLLKGDERTLYNDMVNTIMNPPYMENVKNINIDDWTRAEGARQAFLELLNLETPMQAQMESLRSKVIDQIYERLGQASSNEWATSKVMTTRHPLAFFRGIVYHWKVGMLNPLPAIQNCAQIANIMAINPKDGILISHFAVLAHMAQLNKRPNIVDALGELGQKATLGRYKKEWFKEGLDLLDRSGFRVIGGSQAIGDYLNEPRFIKSAAGQTILDGSSFLFQSTDRMLRTSAYMTAFIEHKVANPTKVITSIDANEILTRAGLYANRMTRDEKARWQSGEVLSTVTQFWSYPARLMEMIWEKGHGRKDSLTVPERLRLLGMNSVLYGLPIGLGGTAVGGVVNTYEHLKQYLVDQGVNVDDGYLGALFNGVVGHISKQLTGVNVSPALGPTGRDLSQNLDEDMGWFRFAFGASGSLLLNTWHSAAPFRRTLWMALNGDINPGALKSDLLDIARNVSSIDKATKFYLAMVHHNAFTKAGQPIGKEGDVDTWGGLMYAITGQLPDKLDHLMWEKKITDEMPQILGQLGKQAAQDLRLSREAEANGDLELAAFYAKRSNLLLKGLPLQERNQVAHKALTGGKSLSDSIPTQWEKHSPSVSKDFKQTFGKYFNIPDTGE